MINERLKILLKRLGLSQRQFALRINLDPGYLSRILQGKVIPSTRILLLISSVFQVNRRWLETGEGEIFSTSDVSALKQQLLSTIDTLDDEQVKATLSFVKYLQEFDRSDKK